MYCIRCGVALADTEKQCPLCNTVVYHPELHQPACAPLYPQEQPAIQKKPWGILLIITLLLFLLPISICIVCDKQINGMIDWSGFVTGALLLMYTVTVLPRWFSCQKPLIFTPLSFVAVGLYLLYINHATNGNWFVSFALPVTACFGLLVTAVVVLSIYLPKARLYIFGGAFLALGGLMLLLEFLLHTTFHLPAVGTWSFYPLIVFSLLGIGLLLIALLPPVRQSLHRKFFV